MHNMRNETEKHEKISEPFILACKVGQVVTVNDLDVERLEPGTYDVVAEYSTIHVSGESVNFGGTTTVRRVS